MAVIYCLRRTYGFENKIIHPQTSDDKHILLFFPIIVDVNS